MCFLNTNEGLHGEIGVETGSFLPCHDLFFLPSKPSSAQLALAPAHAEN